VNPRQRGREVLRRKLRAEQAVRDHQDGDGEERNLKQSARVAPAEQATEDGQAQEVYGGGLRRRVLWRGRAVWVRRRFSLTGHL
jgi:hypothetical protein